MSVGRRLTQQQTFAAFAFLPSGPQELPGLKPTSSGDLGKVWKTRVQRETPLPPRPCTQSAGLSEPSQLPDRRLTPSTAAGSASETGNVSSRATASVTSWQRRYSTLSSLLVPSGFLRKQPAGRAVAAGLQGSLSRPRTARCQEAAGKPQT